MLRAAIIGTGFFANNHLNAWKMVDGTEVVALCDRDQSRLDAAGDAFGIDARYSDAQTMLSENQLDFVDIITTAPTHRPLVELSLRHGCNVICQKPFAENLADAHAMVNAARDADKTLMVHENFRWQSAVRSVIETLRAGRIGTPFFCRASFRSGYDVFSGQPYLAKGERFIIEDLGIHILDVTRALMGDVTRLTATTARINPNIVGEDVATILLAHENGTTSIVDCSYATRRTPETFPETLIEIDGDKGVLRLEAGYQLVVQNEAGEDRIDVSPPVLDWAERPWHNIQESVVAIQQSFVDCLKSGAAPETSGEDNLKTFALVEAAYLSAKQGITVDIAELTGKRP